MEKLKKKNYLILVKIIFENNYNENITVKDPSIAGCSLEGDCNAVLVGNNETHDNIIIISKDKNIVNHVINSIQWGKKTISSDDAEETTTSSHSSSSEPSTYAYKSDGMQRF